MAINITVDNNRNLAGIQALLEDETTGVQTQATPDDGNEINVTLDGSNNLLGLLAPFASLLNGTSLLGQTSLALSLAQKNYAVLHDAASSSSDFIKVEVTAGETINDLFFAGSNGQPLNGAQVFISPGVPLQTLTGDNIYLYSSGDFAIATTGSTLNAAGARVVAAFYLNDTTSNHLTASIQTVTFEALKHPDSADPDDAINWSDALRVGASGSLSFDFDKLASQSSLWVAVGNSSEAVLITGSSPVVDTTTGKKTNDSDVIHTSQGGVNATIGVNNQLFDNVNESATFTLVTGLQGLVGADAGVLSDYVIDDPTSGGVEQGIDYSGYIPNVLGAGIFISQDQGSPNAVKSLDINVYNTNNATPEEGFGYVYSDGTTKTGNALTDDTAVNVTTVTVKDAQGQTVAVWAVSPGQGQVASGSTVGGVQVTINGNNIDVNNFGVKYTISWTTSSAFDRFNVVNEAGAWDIGRVDVLRTIPGSTPVGDKLYVEDDGPGLAGQTASARVEEDELSSSNNPADLSNGITDNDLFTDVATFNNAALQAVVSAGTDSPATFSLNLSVSGAVLDTSGNAVTSKGDALSWSVSNGVVSAVAGGRTIFTLAQTAGGNTPNDPTDDVFTVNLQDQIDHANAAGDTGIKTLDLTPAFSAKDADGDSVDLNGTNNDQRPIQLIVENDIPGLSGQTASVRVEEDELSTSHNPADLSNGITDGDAFTDIATFNNAALQAVVAPGADEPVTFSLNLSASGAVLDSGGNAVTSKGDALSWSVNNGVISAVAGGRTIFTLSQTAGGNTPNDPTDDVFTVNLQDQIDHSNAAGDDGTKTLDLTPAFSAKDYDGDQVDLNGSNNLARPIQLVVENDIPGLSGQTASVRVEEDELSSANNPADLSNGITDNDAFTDVATFNNTALQAIVAPGADEPVNFSLNLSASGAVLDSGGNAVTSKGDALSWSVNNGVVSAVAGGRTIFTLAQTAGANTPNDPTDDVFTVNLQDQIDHSNAAGDDGTKTLDLTPAFSAKDYDGDQVDLNGSNNLSRPIQLVVENDVPGLSGQTASARVEEDELSSANNPADLSNGITDNDAYTDVATFNNAALQAVVALGADEPVTFSVNLSASGAVLDSNGNAVTSKGDALSWSVSNGVVQAVAGGRVILTVAQTAGANTAADPTDDVFTVNLQDQIDHATGSGDDGIKTLDLTPAFSAKDYDGDQVDLNGSNNLARPIQLVVENDVPKFSSQITGATLDQGSSTPVSNSLNGVSGADESAHYTIDKYQDLSGYIEVLSGDAQTVNYYVDNNGQQGALAFRLQVSDTNTIGGVNDNSGMYTFTNFLPPPQEKLEFDFTYFPSGSHLYGVLIDSDEQNDPTPDSGLFVAGRNITLGSNGGMVTGGGATDVIHTSQGGQGPVTIGVNDQMFKAGAGAVFVYLDHPDRNSTATASGADGLTSTTADDADSLGFQGTIESLKASVEVVQLQGSETTGMMITAYDLPDSDGGVLAAADPMGSITKKNAADDVSTDSARNWMDSQYSGSDTNTSGDILHSATEVKINTIKVFDTGAADPKAIFTINTTTGAVTTVLGSAGISVDADQDNNGTYDDVVVFGFSTLDTIEWTTDAAHDAVLIEGYSGAWDVGGFNIEQGIDTPDIDLSFSVAVTDKDGDTYRGLDTTWDDFTIKLDGTGTFNDANNVPPLPSASWVPSYDLI